MIEEYIMYDEHGVKMQKEYLGDNKGGSFSALRDFLCDYFSTNELRLLAFDLQVAARIQAKDRVLKYSNDEMIRINRQYSDLWANYLWLENKHRCFYKQGIQVSKLEGYYQDNWINWRHMLWKPNIEKYLDNDNLLISQRKCLSVHICINRLLPTRTNAIHFRKILKKIDLLVFTLTQAKDRILKYSYDLVDNLKLYLFKRLWLLHSICIGII